MKDFTKKFVCLNILFALLFLPFFSTKIHAQTTAQSSVPKIEFEKYTLPNGLQVILHVDRKLPIVHVNQWFHVGSANERVGRSGFAHLFEHMMFQGSKNASKDYFTYVEAAGANLRAFPPTRFAIKFSPVKSTCFRRMDRGLIL